MVQVWEPPAFFWGRNRNTKEWRKGIKKKKSKAGQICMHAWYRTRGHRHTKRRPTGNGTKCVQSCCSKPAPFPRRLNRFEHLLCRKEFLRSLAKNFETHLLRCCCCRCWIRSCCLRCCCPRTHRIHHHFHPRCCRRSHRIQTFV